MTATAKSSSPSATTTSDHDTVSPERIGELCEELSANLNKSVAEISGLNRQSGILSLNAAIEAARAGDQFGAAFGVVANAMRDLSTKTSEVASSMTGKTTDNIVELKRINAVLSTNHRGTRLSDVALTNIDLIDRNLYERTCDVRWWATDPSLYEALEKNTDDGYAYASHRLGVILDSYTVYCDLVLCNLDGRVVADGRPKKYQSIGSSQAQAKWFQEAKATRSGDEYGFETVHKSPLVDGQHVLVYSCCVRKRGDAHGKPLGVLGIVFNWDDLAQTIVNNLPLTEEEKARTRACIVDDRGLVLADCHNRQLSETIEFVERESLFEKEKDFVITDIHGQKSCIGYAKSPGYETYATGWRSLVMQSL